MSDTESDPYRRTVRELSDRIVAAQRPIRILDAIKWDADVQAGFFAAKFKRQPDVDRRYYEHRPLKFDPQAKRREFDDIARDIRRQLGEFNPLGRMMERMCREYRDVVRMLETRGEPEFSSLSGRIYGSATDAFHAGDPNLRDMAEMISDTLVNLDRDSGVERDEKLISGAEAAERLRARLAAYFDGAAQTVQVRLDDGIVSDAAAGADYIKIRKDATFSDRDVRALEIHEGWVHLGTTLNGLSQPVCTFLSKGAPSSTITQEGLAIISEVFYFASYPARVKRITNRIRAVSMAEQGASFIDVFEFYRGQGFDESESYNNAVRVFRGSTPEGGPFTKDLVYSKGFVLIYNFIRLSVGRGLPGRIPLLFCGKTTLEDVRTLADL
ncbi:MAG: flavohemoglobin expression-modulating QEGLA motif protein, partial [Gammaproteobacteria bacterium]|nr:flavohemoglobin expression-modulating QEGLA motif protein [Gammaproteobacteria bacterium]